MVVQNPLMYYAKQMFLYLHGNEKDLYMKWIGEIVE
jgi:hypothetical protein